MSALPPIRLTKEKPKPIPGVTVPMPGDEEEFNRLAIPGVPDPQIIPMSQQVPTGPTEEERRQQEAEEFLRDHPQQRPATPEEIEAERQATLATIPHAAGKPIPEIAGITEEQLRNNPSNYQPAMEQTVAANTFQATSTEVIRPTVTMNPSVNTEAAKPAVIAVTVTQDERQQWVCVQGDGIRTITDTVKHPIFGSDAHLMDQLVKCPMCGSISVRKVMDGEDPDRHP